MVGAAALCAADEEAARPGGDGSQQRSFAIGEVFVLRQAAGGGGSGGGGRLDAVEIANQQVDGQAEGAAMVRAMVGGDDQQLITPQCVYQFQSQAGRSIPAQHQQAIAHKNTCFR